ncbi:bifunctional phosphoribosylaminoimidazolecarboxamide formyltransferase/IMP cyclohydrolase [Tabrizicola sp.]|jgi:phosphoribosylaminoimidazolecarboxamide formyltransferase / IMP cyclohydrolase|uniref:bifunctional phosphoribosylaminoimidazolecarboxamide formyltransferase/IMP cyclohydrolase n=1 Tax=Tabrizicola sp. TaxID=2005166 RepID=UPI0025DB113F|nr:bifunctional phosphoribosylaminoimidazolecarboxamide formyltransferase/IMP cyclohydrolase [Tabrizicola sp.]MBY0350630.1 bifunctional phosphoribosylaminoimidazolecarboxamide formyltransferase/IMP cyclohydrolase [Tabrizicola sp.]MDK2773547.1 bifunctional phosphoribosylaminoimidazolecarboxamide formyltransferase/IMP cyclohydrolase [Tabrizicola sp.]
MTNLVPIGRALISVSDKTGLLDLARALAGAGVELISTGGTSGMLRAAGLAVRDVAEVTGFPEMMDGRVKTLHPNVHGGLLALRDDDEHLVAMAAHGIEPIDLLVVNLYPFEETVARGADPATCIENIDIGGPAMIRAAAKNHKFVTVVTDPADYGALLAQLRAHDGATTLACRQKLALTAYARTAAYDTAVSTWLAGEIREPAPRYRSFAGKLAQTLRYGENPHQAAAFYVDGSRRPGVATARQWQGKELSYNNINDTDAAFELVAELGGAPACAIIKHANPCGAAVAGTLVEAYRRAYQCDQTSAFGGIVALNQILDGATAEEIVKIFTEVVIAPDATEEARAVFAGKKNLRLLTTGAMPDPKAAGLAFKQVAGGFLVQDRDAGHLTVPDLQVVTRRSPTEAELRDLSFAWTVAKHVKSNAIVYVKDGATVGVGAGQMSRIDSTRIAARKAEDLAEALGLAEPPTKGSVVASDAFFPFADGLIAAAGAGATAIVQPGGSMRDDEVIAAADARGLAMVFTGQRHFRH